MLIVPYGIICLLLKNKGFHSPVCLDFKSVIQSSKTSNKLYYFILYKFSFAKYSFKAYAHGYFIVLDSSCYKFG